MFSTVVLDASYYFLRHSLLEACLVIPKLMKEENLLFWVHFLHRAYKLRVDGVRLRNVGVGTCTHT